MPGGGGPGGKEGGCQLEVVVRRPREAIPMARPVLNKFANCCDRSKPLDHLGHRKWCYPMGQRWPHLSLRLMSSPQPLLLLP